MTTELQDSAFEKEVLQSDLPVLVDFWAPWCGPCRALAPVVSELEQEYAGKVKIMKLNVDENPLAPGKYGIRAIPTLIFFQKGKVVDQVTGSVAKATLKQSLDKLL